MEQSNLYDILGVSKSASPDEIKKAFKKLAVEYHPDKNQGCKEKEDKFKSINEAYSVLSDPQKKAMYDQFGTIDGSGAPPDLNEVLKSMFGGVPDGIPGMAGMPGGFSFVFNMPGMAGMSGAMPGAELPDDIFAQIFGGMKRPQNFKYDVVEVNVDICDIHYGNNKKVEFELLEQCNVCQGSGASDPNQIIKCVTCKGMGEVIQQIGPFMNKMRCPSCAGNGSAIKKPCHTCKGQKTIYNKKVFDLKLPKGIPNNHEVRMPGRGSFNVQTKQNKDMVFKFKHSIQDPYKLDENLNVIMSIPITIEELVGGFAKQIKLYKDDITITSDRYFNPKKPTVLNGKGIYDMKNDVTTDLHLKFEVEFIDSEKLAKYKDIFHKIFKKPNVNEAENVVDIHGEK